MLVRNLATILIARIYKIPFIVEGIGVGPFHRWISQKMAIVILKLASSVVVRSTASKSAATQLAGKECTVSHDPAFDYLANNIKPRCLSLMDQKLVNKLSSRHTDTPLICINMRPITNRIVAPAGLIASQRAAEIAPDKLENALIQFAKLRPVCYVFFPLELETNTGSDLDAAYALAEHLPPWVDFHIWQEPAGIDEILALLGRADAAVTMRLHAAIFALSQNVPTIGIDYLAGGRGKVGELFEDCEVSNRKFGIMELNPDCIARSLVELTKVISHRTRG